MGAAHYLINARTLATATALFLTLPPLGDPRQHDPQLSHDAYVPLDNASSEVLADAMTPSSYVIGSPNVLFSLLTGVAARLVKESKSLAADFSRTVDKEFWNLLR